MNLAHSMPNVSYSNINPDLLQQADILKHKIHQDRNEP